MVIFVIESMVKNKNFKLGNFFLEIKHNVYAGDVSSPIRLKIWEHLVESGIPALMMWSTNNDAGYDLLVCNNYSREIINHNGIKFLNKL